MKACTKCKTEKPADAFGPRAGVRDGLRSRCRVCEGVDERDRRAAMSSEERTAKAKAEYWRNPEKKRRRATDWNRAHPEVVREKNRCECMRRRTEWSRGLVVNLSARAKKSGRAFDLTIDFLEQLFAKQRGLCHWLGIPMQASVEKREPRRPSVDRLDNSRGYTQDNVVLTCMFANLGRSTASVEEMQQFVAG